MYIITTYSGCSILVCLQKRHCKMTGCQESERVRHRQYKRGTWRLLYACLQSPCACAVLSISQRYRICHLESLCLSGCKSAMQGPTKPRATVSCTAALKHFFSSESLVCLFIPLHAYSYMPCPYANMSDAQPSAQLSPRSRAHKNTATLSDRVFK